MTEFIPINLTQIKSDYSKLLENKFSVILGSPGSGKTFLAKHLEEIFPKSKYLTVQDFMYEEENELLEEIEEILILDGFDEYRLFEQSKTQVIRNFARKIKKLFKKKNFKVILTCRELDWYGDNDTNALKEILNIEIKEPFFIEPLDEVVLQEFIEKSKVDKAKMLNLYNKGLITTPQLFKIAIEVLDNEDINNKIELFEKFITKSVEEKNISRKTKQSISKDEMFDYLGYMAYFYMFSNIKKFNEEVIFEIDSNRYKKDLIEYLLTTKIFKNNIFIHRTIAEFLCGKFFANKIEKEEINKVLIIDKFKNKNFIYTELRTTYAWLCALSADKELIEIDPFYQLIYGENSHFSIEFKKDIILAIKKYTDKNPYFLDSDAYFLKNELEGFYVNNEEFEEFLIKEFEEAISMKNHYVYLFEIIFTSNVNRLSRKIKSFLYEKMFDNNLIVYIKQKFLESRLFSDNQIKAILNAIKEGKIQDKDNSLKIDILELLINNLTNDEVIDIFKLFEKNNTMHICFFLYNLDFDRKKELVLKIEKETFKNIRRKHDEIFKRYNGLKNFLENFYYELFHTRDIDEIYDFLKQVRKFYKEYEQIKVEKGYINKNIKERTAEELQELSNKLFEKYFNFKFNKNIFHLVYEFNKWFPLTYPSNISEVIISNIKQIKDEKIKKELFWSAMQHFKNKDRFDDVFLKLSKELALEDEYKKFKNPKKSQFEIEQERLEKEIKEEKQKEIKENNKFFRQLNKEKFLNHFGALDFFSYLILFEKENIRDYIDIEIFNEFKGYFKDFIFSGNFIEYIGVDKFVQNLKNNRKIDTVFYTSLCLNKDTEDLLIKLNQNLKIYLYLLSLKEKNVFNICHNNWFIEKIENNNFDLAKSSLIKAFEIKYDLSENIKKRIKDSELEQLKELFNLVLYSDNFVNSYIKVYNFNISKEEINDLKTIENTELLEVFEKFYNNQFLDENELVVFYVNIFDRFSKTSKSIFDKKTRLQIFENFLLKFDNESKMPFKDGVQSDLDITRSFVRDNILKILKDDEIEILLKKEISDYWKNLLKWKLAKNESYSEYKHFRLKELKNFIENRGFLNERDFFRYVILKIDSLIKKIEANENNQKDFFWNGNKTKIENECRDAFINLLDVGKENFLIREEEIGNNRADFTIFSKIKDWKVRIECKKDKHRELFKAVKTQLIDKYLKNKSTYFGIYLVFYFEEKKRNSIFYTKEEIKEEIEKQIPVEWEDKVKVKIIDLKKDSK